MAELLCIVPTYNEVENIDAIVGALLQLSVSPDILVVDDNSPDGTARRVEQLMAQHSGRIHLLERSGKLGLGTAYIAGFNWGLEAGYRYLCEIDADMSHSPSDVPRLLEACTQGANVAIGSRYITGINVVNWPLRRIILSYCASLYVRIVSGMPVHDATAGFVCYEADALTDILAQGVRMKGYGFQIEMKYIAHRLGYTIREIPIVFTDRKKGVSKMSGGIFSEALWGVIRMRFNAPKRKVKSPSS
ncbi:MAG: dolichyl-phosphate beta-D-mannosyltransferase [Bacteroidetes bacterium]|nr:MAG: dolichyl-phosphate beta-D-mannosyltransferase [Bacteroidota bacterium]